MMKIIHQLNLLTLISAIVLIGCNNKSFNEKLESLYDHTVPKITPSKLSELMKTKGDFLYILDTRQWKEHKVSHLKGAIWVGYDEFNKDFVNSIPKDAVIVTYCTVGYRSEKIGEKLLNMGYVKVYNLYGSIAKWINQGYPLYNLQAEETNSVHTYNKRWGKWFEKGEHVYE